MKPLPTAPLTPEDQEILANWSYRYIGDFWWKLPTVARESDRRDAKLMLGLTGMACGTNGICVARLWAGGCIINNVALGARVAIRGYEGQYGDERDDITYFA